MVYLCSKRKSNTNRKTNLLIEYLLLLNVKCVTENRKRALSFLTHWRPWNQLSGNGRHVIRSPFSSFFPDTDVPAKGNRPVGQPLRWGRRRRR